MVSPALPWAACEAAGHGLATQQPPGPAELGSAEPSQQRRFSTCWAVPARTLPADCGKWFLSLFDTSALHPASVSSLGFPVQERDWHAVLQRARAHDVREMRRKGVCWTQPRATWPSWICFEWGFPLGQEFLPTPLVSCLFDLVPFDRLQDRPF